MRRELPSIQSLILNSAQRIAFKVRRGLDHLQGNGSYVKVQKDETREKAIFLERELARRHPGQGF